ncbi:hypothetical protein PC129_g19914 [Phytophthora cactorum]|uniref:Uncharacterized protein n=1 Tax=Phytophthora cactorum TaxID=29920 RepID=A0A8T1B8D0_9STRA|nr:hypothetical protein PC117_g22767 [Phytophthora cactorum]KAG3209067.1 hypothetical protein PC129_g19914 [Phytophthora cactorum]
MHTNDGSLAENWIIEQGGWQLDRVNKAFGYKLGTTQADQHVSRVLSGWHPKEGARLPSLRALEYPVVACAEKIQVLLFTNTLGCDDHTMNLEEDVAEVLTATLILHYPDMLVLSPDSAIVARIRDAMSARAIGEDEVLAWSDTIRRAFTSPPEISKPSDSDPHSAEVLSLVKHQSEQISVLILQIKRLEERLLSVEAKLHPPLDTRSRSWQTDVVSSATIQPEATHESQHSQKPGVALDAASPAFKSEVLSLGEKTQENPRAFLKTNGSTAAADTVLKDLRMLHKAGKLDAHITQFYDRIERGEVVDPTPPAAMPRFICFKPVER